MHSCITPFGCRGRLQELGYDEAAEAALEAAVKAEAGEVRRCRGRVDELAATLSGAPTQQLQSVWQCLFQSPLAQPRHMQTHAVRMSWALVSGVGGGETAHRQYLRSLAAGRRLWLVKPIVHMQAWTSASGTRSAASTAAA